MKIAFDFSVPTVQARATGFMNDLSATGHTVIGGSSAAADIVLKNITCVEGMRDEDLSDNEFYLNMEDSSVRRHGDDIWSFPQRKAFTMFKTTGEETGYFFVPHIVNVDVEPDWDKKARVFFAGQVTGLDINWEVFGGAMRYETHAMLQQHLPDCYDGYLSEGVHSLSPHLDRAKLSPRLPLDEYNAHLRNDLICVSPYGFGEICYRHLESLAFGMLCLSPPIKHVSSLYPPEFYDSFIVYDSYAEMLDKIDYFLIHQDEALDIAKAGHQTYRQYLLAKDGRHISDYLYNRAYEQLAMALESIK